MDKSVARVPGTSIICIWTALIYLGLTINKRRKKSYFLLTFTKQVPDSHLLLHYTQWPGSEQKKRSDAKPHITHLVTSCSDRIASNTVISFLGDDDRSPQLTTVVHQHLFVYHPIGYYIT